MISASRRRWHGRKSFYRVYEGFKAIERREPERFVAVDADKTAEEVLESVIAIMKAKGVINK